MTIAIIPVPGVPMVTEGTALAAVVGDAIESARVGLKDGDVVAVCQKIVSKAEGAVVRLGDVTPSPFAEALAAQGAAPRDPTLRREGDDSRLAHREGESEPQDRRRSRAWYGCPRRGGAGPDSAEAATNLHADQHSEK